MKLYNHNESICKIAIQKKNIIFVIKLSNANTHKKAVMIEFMNTSLTFFTVSHSNPFN